MFGAVFLGSSLETPILLLTGAPDVSQTPF
jgi:hypothetical protein